jgi:Methylamine utilisation protein MauE
MFAMMISAVLIFCRMVIGLVFGIAFLSKVTHFPAFTRAITHFELLPEAFSRGTATLFVGGELVVVLLIALGGPLLEPGFLVGACLLLLFTCALISVLLRKMETSCSCFGPTQKSVSTTDVWRNAVLITCALLGCVAAASNAGQEYPGLSMWVLLGLGATIFVAFWLHLHEIIQLFQ